MCVRLISLAAKNRHTRRHSARNSFYERNPMHTTRVWRKLSAYRYFTYASESFLRRIWAPCASLVQYTSDLLKLFVPSTHRIFSLAASCNTSFWDVFGPLYPFYLRRTTARSVPSGGSWRSLWACVCNSFMTNQDTQCFQWAHGNWADESHTHSFAVPTKARTQCNLGFLSQMMQVRVRLFVIFFFHK